MARFTDYRTFKTALGGRLLQFEIGKVCEQANGQVTVRYGDTVVNCTAVASKEPKQDVDFFPLSCNYEEKMYAVGKIPGGYIKREGKAGEHATLTSRLIDRPLRPLFPKGYRNDVVVTCTAWSVDHDCSPEIAAVIGSSVAIAISDIPWDGPTAGVVVGRVDGDLIINPTYEQRKESDINLTVCGTEEAIMMVEAGAKEVPEEEMLDAIMFGHEEIKNICRFIKEIVAEVGKEKQEYKVFKAGDDVDAAVRAYSTEKMIDAIKTFDKLERLANMEAVEKDALEHFAEEFEGRLSEVSDVTYAIKKEEVRKMILDEGIRPDNRKLTEIRPVWSETGFLPRTHGSGLFKRGQTQALSVATLAPLSEAQNLDSIDIDVTTKRYMHQYNFPGYSTGEAKVSRAPGRREIGHGALAERALLPVIPSEEEFPYAIRVVSEILSSNGSSSMASTCGSTLALMDAGVPIKKPVSGIAMGLIEGINEDGSSRFAVLSDIQGMEDFLGDMDFKVTGTTEGITAIQMDIKIHGLTRPIVEGAIARCREARLFIMDNCMKKAISEPRPEVGEFAPKIISLQIDPEKIGDVVGQRGKTINEIIARTGVKIDITDDGNVSVCGTEADKMDEAVEMIKIITTDFEQGQIFKGKVVSIKEFGAFVEFAPGKEGMVHISKICKERINHVEDVLTLGDTVTVVCLGKDKMGRISFSMKDVAQQ